MNVKLHLQFASVMMAIDTLSGLTIVRDEV